jgi:aspartate/methionine/tyrosine aminotransferase
MNLAAGVAQLGTESAFDVLARARALEAEGVDVVHLEIGQPDFPTPAHVVAAAQRALRAGETGYCPAPGIPELREAAAAWLSSGRGIAVDPAEVLIATGAKPFLFFGVLACAGPGDEVVYPDPGFPIYRSAIAWTGATPVALPLRAGNGFVPDPAELAAAIGPRTRLVILNSPHNPTGAVMSTADLRAVAEILRTTDAWILADEVYGKLVHDGGDAPSLAAVAPDLRERIILVDSCSKTFAMTGWRCGFAAVPAPLREPLTRFFVNSTSCVPPFVQRAAVAALTGPLDDVNAMVQTFRERRDVVVAGLNELPGITCPVPAGAFYAFCDVSGTGIPAARLADRLLSEAGVALLAGDGFGDHAAHHLRISIATGLPRLELAIQRMGELISSRR